MKWFTIIIFTILFMIINSLIAISTQYSFLTMSGFIYGSVLVLLMSYQK